MTLVYSLLAFAALESERPGFKFWLFLLTVSVSRLVSRSLIPYLLLKVLITID